LEINVERLLDVMAATTAATTAATACQLYE
jgi:hypothetical protein